MAADSPAKKSWSLPCTPLESSPPPPPPPAAQRGHHTCIGHPTAFATPFRARSNPHRTHPSRSTRAPQSNQDPRRAFGIQHRPPPPPQPATDPSNISDYVSTKGPVSKACTRSAPHSIDHLARLFFSFGSGWRGCQSASATQPTPIFLFMPEPCSSHERGGNGAGRGGFMTTPLGSRLHLERTMWCWVRPEEPEGLMQCHSGSAA